MKHKNIGDSFDDFLEDEGILGQVEKAAAKAHKEYMEAVEKYGLDKIKDRWGHSNKRYMSDSFFAGFYAGRDYQEEIIRKEKI